MSRHAPEALKTWLLQHNQVMIDQVLDCIEAGRYCTLVGPRFSGKTAILHSVRQTLTPDMQLVHVYVSLDTVDSAAPARFYTNLAQNIARQVAEATRTEQPPTAEVASGMLFRTLLEDTIAGIQRDLVLLLDHLEATPPDLLHALLTSLRAVQMNLQPEQHRFIVVAATAFSLATLMQGEISPFRGIATPVATGDLTDQDSVALLDVLFADDSMPVESPARVALLRQAGGDVRLITLISATCIDAARQNGLASVSAQRVRLAAQAFHHDEAPHYQPLREAIALIERDPDLLLATLLLLRQDVIPLRDLPLSFSPDLDPLYLTGIVKRVDPDSYTIRNRIYQRVLKQHFTPARVSRQLAMAGRWDAALDYLETVARNRRLQKHWDLQLETTINAMYTCGDPKSAIQYMARTLSAVFGLPYARIWLRSADHRHLMAVNTAAETGPQTVIDLASSCPEAQAYRQAYSLRIEEDDFIRRAVPLSVPRHAPVGVVAFDERPASDAVGVSAHEPELINYLNQAARALQEVSTRRERAETIRDISNVIGSSLDLETVLDHILGQMARVLPFDTASIQRINPSQSALQIVACKGFSNPAGVKALTFPLQESFPNVRVWRGKAPLRFSRVRSIFPHLAEPQYQLPRINSWMGIPLVVADEAIGVITLDSATPDIYTPEYEHLAMLIASQAATAIQRARLFERERQEKNLIHTIAQMASAVYDLPRTWELILDGAMQLTGAEFGNIGLVNQRGQLTSLIELGDGTGTISELITAPSIQSWVAEHKQSALISNVGAEEGWKGIYSPGLPNTMSELTVPILRNGSAELVGIINLESPREGAFSDPDRRLLEGLAIHADLAIHNAQQYRTLEERRQHLDALHKAGEMIAQAGLAFDAVPQAILGQAVKVTNASFGTLQLVDGDDLVFVAVWPTDQLAPLCQVVGPMPIAGPGITCRAVRAHAAQLVSDVLQDADFVDVTRKTRSELAVPLIHSERVIGVLNVEHTQPGGLDEEARGLLLSLANLAAIAIQNAARYEELEQTKNFLFTSRDVARMGLLDIDERHTIHQKTFSLASYLSGMRQWLSRLDNNDEIMRRLVQALDHSDELLKTIRSKLAARPQLFDTTEDEKSSTKIDDELSDMVRRWHSERKESIDLQLDLQCSGVRAKIAPKWLSLAIEKLVHNALNAMPNSGQLTVATRCQMGMVQIHIEDTGDGVPTKVRPYFLKSAVPRTKEDGGMGEGARLALFVAQDHGGSLTWQDSPTGTGTVLTMTLPVLEIAQDIPLNPDAV